MDITFKNVSYTYQPNSPFEHIALRDVSFHIPSQSFVAIIGHTGSGKSTLIQHLNGLIRPTTGEVIVGDFILNETKKIKNIKQLRSKVGIVFQYPEHQLFEETIEKDIAFGPKNFGVSEEEIKKRTIEVMEQVGLSIDMLNRSPFELSGGQMRRVAIASILAIRPDVYVLDEPTAGLDPRGQKEIMDMFYRIHQEEQKTMILVTHSMEDALRYADHIIILNNGKKYMEGKPEEIFQNEAALHNVQLEIPESIRFIQQYNETFNETLALTEQSEQMIAHYIKETIRGVHQ